METDKKRRSENWGGRREGSGKKALKVKRDCPLMVRISREAMEMLNAHTLNKSEFLDNYILNMPANIGRDGKPAIRRTQPIQLQAVGTGEEQ